ncbi:MAG: zinc-dependent alcohol dehydrogenase family protein [Thermoplasmata archaeon]
MKAMVLRTPAPSTAHPLTLEEVEDPTPGDDEVLVQVERCGVCRTDLHVVEGDLPPIRESVIPGHEVVGRVVRAGRGVRGLSEGTRVGVPWLGRTCGRCEYCLSSRENLCDHKEFTGYSRNGGYAEYVVGTEGYVLPLPSGDPTRWAPMMCAGIIGYRAFKLAGPPPGGRVGFFGFGGSAHLTLQLAGRLGYETVAFSRNPRHLDLATSLGASETVLTSSKADADHAPRLDSAIVFAPAGEIVRDALARLKKGGTIAIAAIHMTPIPVLDYDRLLFGERRIVSVEANTRQDAREFIGLATRLRLESTVQLRPLHDANEALADLGRGRVSGALVLDCTAPAPGLDRAT